MNTLRFSPWVISVALLTPLVFSVPVEARGGGAVRAGGGGIGGGARAANVRQSGNFSHNLQNSGNLSTRPVNTSNVNRANVTNNINNRGGNTVNTFDPNTRTNINNTPVINNPNHTVNNISGNTINVNGNNWRGGGWYGGGYYVPPAWGWSAAAFAGGLAIGAAISQPPPYYSNIYVGGNPYIYSDGVYMAPQGSSYVVVAPPVGAVVTYLPDGCQAFSQNGGQYFSCSGVTYQPFYENGAVAYQVIGTQS